MILGAKPRGVTLIELLVSIAVLGVLASAAMPLLFVSTTRSRELELRRTLRHVRDGLDRFKAEYDKAKANSRDALPEFRKLVSADRSGYPLTFEEMVQTKILRRVPQDPMSSDGKWVLLSYSDNPDTSLSDGKDIYDIHSASKAVALDGTTYDTW
ncbi:MAG TPA: type II secretion system protein [Candidatus Sulfotelmatobacter sp.]|nr:type II secretion system protein [Candidatus Sulfotelmatobacter sp.]